MRRNGLGVQHCGLAKDTVVGERGEGKGEGHEKTEGLKKVYGGDALKREGLPSKYGGCPGWLISQDH